MTRVQVYTEDGVRPFDADDLAAARDAEGTTWVRATGASAEQLRAVADVFGVHPLSVEDLLNDVRPKTEEFADYTVTLVKTVTLRRGDTSFAEELRETPVGLFVGEDWVLTLSPGNVEAVDRVWATVESEDRRLLTRGPDFTFYRVLDRVVDDYFTLLDEVEDRIEELEAGVLESPDHDTLAVINDVRRELLSIRKVLWPTREAASVLARGDPDQIHPDTEKYFRDVYDHLVQLVDLTETYRELASGARDIYLNRLSMSTNEVMKTLTVVATIILPLTFIVGVYGMNFGDSPYNMPELGWEFAYPAVVLGMALVSVVMLLYFRQEGWL